MSITKSYNRRTNTTYAYETTYEWDPDQQKRVQRKHCIGQFDPETGEIIPNGKRGRPSGSALTVREEQSVLQRKESKQAKEISELNSRLGSIEQTLEALTREIHGLKTQAEEFLGQE